MVFLKSLSTFVTSIIILIGIHLVTYHSALVNGKNSIAMKILGKHGCMLITRLIILIGSKDKTRESMQVQARSKFALIEANRQAGEVCLVGSSTFTYWTRLVNDLKPLECLNLAFGGSITTDLLVHVDAIARFQPKVMVYYCGTNDLSMGKSPREAVEGFISFVNEIRIRLPQIAFVYVSIILTPFQKQIGNSAKVKTANDLIQKFVLSQLDDQIMYFVDINQDERFTTNWNWYLNDGLHLNDEGHSELGKLIKPFVEIALERVGS